VKVVGHHAKALQHPTALLASLVQAILKSLMSSLVNEKILPVIPHGGEKGSFRAEKRGNHSVLFEINM